jgi:predicted nucleic acid-binding protein
MSPSHSFGVGVPEAAVDKAGGAPIADDLETARRPRQVDRDVAHGHRYLGVVGVAPEVTQPTTAAHMPFEVSNVLRRLVDQTVVSADLAALALRDLIAMPVDLLAHDVLALRIWELRHNLTAYDAAHVAAAELVDAPLATLDRRLAAAPGTRCEFWLP